jgi:hypothetical protein
MPRAMVLRATNFRVCAGLDFRSMHAQTRESGSAAFTRGFAPRSPTPQAKLVGTPARWSLPPSSVQRGKSAKHCLPMAGRRSEFHGLAACDLLPAGKDSAAIAFRYPLFHVGRTGGEFRGADVGAYATDGDIRVPRSLSLQRDAQRLDTVRRQFQRELRTRDLNRA